MTTDNPATDLVIIYLAPAIAGGPPLAGVFPLTARAFDLLRANNLPLAALVGGISTLTLHRAKAGTVLDAATAAGLRVQVIDKDESDATMTLTPEGAMIHDAMADWIRAQPPESPILTRLDAALDQLYSDPDGDGVSFVPSVRERLGRFRFDDPNETFEGFLTRLSDAIEQHIADRTS